METKTQIRKRKLRECVVSLISKTLRAAEITGLAVPIDSTALYMEICTADKRGPRVLQRCRKGTSKRAQYLHAMLRFHRGDTGGSLWGPMMARWLIEDAAQRDQIENLAMLSLRVSGQQLVAADLWSKALRGE